MHSLTDPAGNEITEPFNIKHDYFREFRNRPRKGISGQSFRAMRGHKINFVTPG